MSRLPDVDLTVLVQAAAEGSVNSRAAHHGGPAWVDLAPGAQNSVREVALPFMFHGSKALAGLGYFKARQVGAGSEIAGCTSGALLRVMRLSDGGGWVYERMSGDTWVYGGHYANSERLLERYPAEEYVLTLLYPGDQS